MAAAYSVGRHHKDDAASRPWLLRLYYSKAVLFTCVAGDQIFFCALYALPHVPEVARPALMVSAPVFALKQLINVVQLWAAFRDIVAVDAAERDAAAKGAKNAKRASAKALVSPRGSKAPVSPRARKVASEKATPKAPKARKTR